MLRIPGHADPAWRSSRRRHVRRASASCSACRACASRGFYLAVATLACAVLHPLGLTKVGWFTNYSSSGVITAQQIVILGYAFDTPAAKYLLVLSIVALMALAAKNMAAQQRGPLVDGGARHGRRRRSDRHPPDAARSCSRSRSARSTAASPARCTRTPISAPSSRRPSTSTCRSGSCSWSSSAASARILGSFLGAAFITLLPILLTVSVRSLEHDARHLRIAGERHVEPGIDGLRRR